MARSSDRPKRLRGDDGRSKVYPLLVVVWLVLTAVVVVAIVGSHWWHQQGPLNTFNPKGTNARKIQDLVTPVFVTAGFVFVVVEGLILGLVIKNRKKDDDDEFPGQGHGSNTLEIVWTAIPFFVLFFIAVKAVPVIFQLEDFKHTDMQVRVEGQQWWWQFKYDNNGDGKYGGSGDIVTANELVIPAGENVQMHITSNDVIHSFWIPSLNGKRDAVPGFTSSWKMQADKPGRYRGQCTEFCGLSHGRMQMYVIALPKAQYEAWVANQLKAAVEKTRADFSSVDDWNKYEAGRTLFKTTCTACHTINGLGHPPGGVAAQVSGQAPRLTHLMSRDVFAGSTLALYLGVQDTLAGDTPVTNYLDKAYVDGKTVPDVNNLRNWLQNPSSIKPMAPNPVVPNPHPGPKRPPTVGRGMPNLNLTQDQMSQLIAYLTTLK